VGSIDVLKVRIECARKCDRLWTGCCGILPKSILSMSRFHFW
jgi:hypothetical protein